jgi:hypothetical protein
LGSGVLLEPVFFAITSLRPELAKMDAAIKAEDFKNPTALFLGVLNRIAAVVVYLICAGIFWLTLHPAFYYLEWVILLLILALLVLPLSLTVALKGKLQSKWKFALYFLVVLSAAAYFKLPLKLAFLTIRPQLAQIVSATNPGSFAGLQSDINSTLFRISAESTTTRNLRMAGDNCNTNRILFILADDAESAFIYSPGGIQDLCYNSGAAGHLMGDWYWMKED